MIEITEFTCPKCGSHLWGSAVIYEKYNPAPPGCVQGEGIGPLTLMGYCHGSGCHFSWKRDLDDALYMRGTGRFMETSVVGKKP